jgi:hypothetical protein
MGTAGAISRIPGTQVARLRYRPNHAQENSMSASHDSEHRTVVSTEEAREGVTGHNVRYVLGIGLVAVIVAFAIVYAVYFA